MNRAFKIFAMLLVTMIAYNSYAGSLLSGTNIAAISKEQAKNVALVHARVIGANADINASVRLNSMPKYAVGAMAHTRYDSDAGAYQVIVNRSESWQNCKMVLVVHDRTGELLKKSMVCR
ncbi:MAG: hypothetical protein ACKOX6_06165 [Bdellovibrio sp.]